MDAAAGVSTFKGRVSKGREKRSRVKIEEEGECLVKSFSNIVNTLAN